MQDAEEERFDELHKYLGHQYCHDLEPSASGFKRCVAHLLFEQTRTYFVVMIILFFNDRLWQLMSIFIVQNIYYGIQLTRVRAKSIEQRFADWINFAFSMAVNYYQLVTLVEVKQKVLNFSGWGINTIFFLFMVITLGQPSLLCLN